MTTTIANRIYIANPSEEVIGWAKEHLEFPNPEYVKKERMGFWVGRTPRMLRLYEWNGNVLILPFGVCREIMPLLKGTPLVCDFRQNSVIAYGEPVPLYDYQEEAVKRLVEAKYGILKAQTGSGKTQISIGLIKTLRRRALWLCHTADLLKQSLDRALRYMDAGLTGTITEGKVNVGVGVTFATVQTMANLELTQYRDYWDVVIVDECLPGGTEILTENGEKKIKDITTKDRVLTLDRDGKPEYRGVVRTFRRVPNSMVRIVLQDPDALDIHCTGNHPILTKRGYIRADEITDHDEVCRVRETDGHFRNEPGEKVQPDAREGQGVLLRGVQPVCEEPVDGGAPGKVAAGNDQAEPGNGCKKDDGAQSDEESGNAGAHVKNTEGDRAQAEDSRGERYGKHSGPGHHAERAEGSAARGGIRRADEGSAGKRVPDMLQAGHRNSGDTAGDRGGRVLPLLAGKAGAGPEKRFTVEFVGVDRIEVQEPTSDGTYGGLCADGYVYNLEVEGNRNYFANGVNVHNCHRAAASATSFTRYEKVLNHLSARHKYGLTATPERSDGLIQATFALIGGVAYEVPEAAVADRVTGVKVRTVETDTELTEECLNPDGTLNYVRMIGYLTGNAERNRLIARKICENAGHSCLVLSDRLEQLEDIMRMLPEELQADAAFVNGKMTSKRARAEREQAIEDMRTGRKRVLFASYGLAKEGLDIPCLDRLFLASPAKFSAVITQAVGRVRRVAEGKDTPLVYDFVDTEIGFCARAYRERKRCYKKLGAEMDGTEKGFLR